MNEVTSRSVTRTIVLCGACGGSGIKSKSELSDYHKGEYRHWKVKCEFCFGMGRLHQTTTIELSPVEPVPVEEF